MRPRRLARKPARQRTAAIRRDAAGIDIGARGIHVAVDPERDARPVREFQTFTQDLYALADWLESCGARTVAMESTGVFWIPLFQILEARGLEVCLVNARHVKHVPGRKTDIADCQWLQYLHSVGLLTASFRPAQSICGLRSLLRHRESLIQAAAAHVQRMQKALDQMNLQLHHVISDITGLTGLAIIDAMLAGERDPAKLAALRNRRIHASVETVTKSLVGDYRPEHVFTLRQSLGAYRYHQQLVAECDVEIERHLTTIPNAQPGVSAPPASATRRKPRGNEPRFDLRTHLHRIFGVDLTTIPGIDVLTAHTLLTEVGPELSKFPTPAAFASWLGLCPDNRISGGKVLSVKTRRVKNRAALALRMSAQAVQGSRAALGGYYRRMRAKLGGPMAITATAHKLARVVYHLIATGQPYDESVFLKHEASHRERVRKRLHAQAAALGFKLVPSTVVP
jgi:transposase